MNAQRSAHSELSHAAGVRLVIDLACGTLPGRVANVNAGLDLGSSTTVVAFGDEYADAGRESGSTQAAALANRSG
ncbi:uncharacterized protein BT62DRAFT_999760 [Guyanagaster necrorhizus]|uniref:Uncharacterized protein n=1 Tax=Guyanagaster necrorhizus TaxID=856835 RepID=A0A9P7W404_9AGAR|nr:uncharacterized protein BT62DRAFT_999760 [Guyanagaster necrorhizus MCA 3950]KAG7452020.1 hypothetical protein BT62DRAFT_999760 [Guyanagaster necrorhizus MCA 3950]